VKGLADRLSQQAVEAGGSLNLEVEVSGGSSPDTVAVARNCQTRLAAPARRVGVTKVHERWKPLESSGSNLVDMGRAALVDLFELGLPRVGVADVAVRKDCGVRTAGLQGYSSIPSPSTGGQ
jgi:hypothetical protein